MTGGEAEIVGAALEALGCGILVVDVRAALGLVNCGDVDVTPSRIEAAFERIEEAAWRIASDGATVVGFGGDGSISVPLGARRGAYMAEPLRASRR